MTVSAYDFVLSLAPPGLESYVKAFLDNVMPKVIAYLMFLWALTGCYFIFRFIFTILNGFFIRWIRPSKNLIKSYGTWAIVTGSTDGIGEAMATELARKGLNLLLISRSKDKLIATAQKINAKYPKVLIKFLDIDYGNFDKAAQARVENEIKDLDIGILINNVGISYPYPKYFHELDHSRVEQLISVNVNSTTFMTKLVLPKLVNKKRGAIVNVSSFAGVAVSPLLSQYTAAKSYIAMFSRALNVELADFNVHVQVQTPLFVSTKLAKIKNSTLLIPSPKTYASYAVACIGYEADISPYWAHALQLYIVSFIPSWVLEAWLIKLSHYGIRKAGMKKDAKVAAAAAGTAGGASTTEGAKKNK